jgi:hypothetical protein
VLLSNQNAGLAAGGTLGMGGTEICFEKVGGGKGNLFALSSILASR